MKKLLLIDANSLIHRAFHALPPLTSNEGNPSGALFGLSSILLKTVREQKPDYIAAAFDRPEATFRKEMFDDYKATRPKAPDELVSQIIEARNLFGAFGIKTFEKAGFEADDIIGTLAERFGGNGDGVEVVILTGDLDSLQLVRGKEVTVEILKKGVSETARYDEAAVVERYGLPPKLLADYKGLVGDKSDNIPGVKNVGPKTAERLLKEYGNLEGIFSPKAKGDPAAEKIGPSKDIALLSKKLGTIDREVSVSAKLGDLAFGGIPEEKLRNYFSRWNFESLAKRIGNSPVAASGPAAPPDRTSILNASFIPSAGELNETARRTKGAKVAWEWKPIAKDLLRSEKSIPQNIFDLSIAFWLLHPDAGNPSREEIAEKILRRKYDGEDLIWKNLFPLLNERLAKNGLAGIFADLEMPVVGILAAMELAGIKTDPAAARSIVAELDGRLSGLSRSIERLAGFSFNLNSPKQVAEALFEKLKLTPAKRKKTKSGNFSTSSEALASLRGTEIVDLILEYREAFKMKSTYLEPILAMTENDGRLRTTFLQTGTATGRIASEKPNLQNIPQESSWSEKIRNVFVAEEGWSLASFDYSQLELRLLAHVADGKSLKKAFRNNLDIHAMTAAEIFGVPEGAVTKEQRRIGKTLNFGVAYGMGARAFSQTAGIELREAERFIAKYFEKFPSIRRWQEEVKASANRDGFVQNPHGRKRWFPEPWNGRVAAENERAAINMPIQSLGADILKKAMIDSSHFIKRSEEFKGKIRMILTIHDELLFEIRDDILREVIPTIAGIMENAESISVPLKIETKVGKRWGDLKKYESHKLL